MGTTDKNATSVMAPAAWPPRETTDDGPAVLVLVYPPGANLGRRFPLSGTHTVGRSADVDIPIEEDAVSRQHARFSRGDGTWLLEDLGSTNGSFVNDARITSGQKKMRDGDMVRFGTAILKFLSGNNIEAAYHEEIYKMSVLDGLTEVHNKRYFLEFMERELNKAIRLGQPLSLILFDIDHFKKVNDTHGHLTGDAVLRELARRLKPQMRRDDLLARYGGEEFACAMLGTDAAGARAFAETLRASVAKDPFHHEAVTLPVTISMGVAQCDLERGSVEGLIARADENLYQAKRNGRNCVVG
jgi:diguanylate cyclase (GGDEF)-like protein